MPLRSHGFHDPMYEVRLALIAAIPDGIPAELRGHTPFQVFTGTRKVPIAPQHFTPGLQPGPWS